MYTLDLGLRMRSTAGKLRSCYKGDKFAEGHLVRPASRPVQPRQRGSLLLFLGDVIIVLASTSRGPPSFSERYQTSGRSKNSRKSLKVPRRTNSVP